MRLRFWPYFLFSGLATLYTFANVHFVIIPEVQTETGEIGGPSQVFLSVMVSPIVMALSLMFWILLVHPLFIYLNRRNHLNFYSIVGVPLALALSTGLLLFSLTESNQNLSELFSDIVQMCFAVYPILLLCSMIYWLFYRGWQHSPRTQNEAGV